MLRHSSIAKALWLLAIALMLVRVGETHLHLCLDGQDRAVTMHVQDAPTHHDGSVSTNGHTDRDVDSSVMPWVKKAGAEEMPVVLLAAIVLALFFPIVGKATPRWRLTLPILVHVSSLRPPLRGPPR